MSPNSQHPKTFPSLPHKQFLFDRPLFIHPLQRLSAQLSSINNDPKAPNIHICREDANSPLAFGGNKIRKLEYVIPDALAAGATALVTTGGIQSNHMRAVSAVAAHLGLKCVLLPRDAVAESDMPDVDMYASAGNAQFRALLGAERMPVGSGQEEVMEELRGRGEVPYWIPSGASTHEKGGLGFARWAFELSEWEKGSGVRFDTVAVACASGSTLGGMVAGFKYLAKYVGGEEVLRKRAKRRVIGIDAYAKEGDEVARTILEIARRTIKLLGSLEMDISQEDVVVDKRFNAGAYGKCDEKTLEAMRIMARSEGVVLDPVYTGKAFAGILGMARTGEFEEEENVLFVHTGGQPAFGAYLGLHL